MAIIYTYGYDSNIDGEDALLGTDSNGKKTKQFKISDLTEYISENIGVVSGVNSITTTDSAFISLTPNTPTDGNVTITSTLSATGTPDETTYLRGDNTWATIPADTDNYVDSISFNIGNGDLTLGRTGVLPDLVQNLDGRYALSSGNVIGSGTTNYVSKWQDPTTLTDSVIYDNGTNVGIGTISPAYRLDISANTAGPDGISVVNTNTGGSSLPFISVTNNVAGRGGHLGYNPPTYNAFPVLTNYLDLVSYSQTSGFIIRTSGTGNIKFLQGGITASNERFTINTNDVTVNTGLSNVDFRVKGTSGDILFVDASSGYVGVGNTSPITKLHVGGDVLIEDNTATLSLKTTQAATFSSIQFESLANSGIGGGGSVDHLSFFTASNTRMRILANGDVGIGTTSPSQKLHVSGNARLTGAFYDSNNSAGTIGQVLTSTSTSTEWTDPGSITQVPVPITAFAGGSLALAATVNFVYFSWLGGSGTYTLNLPSAVTYPYKVIRFVTDGGTNASNKIHIEGSFGQTVDGGVFYALDKAYNGVQIWSDGSEWIVIQAKAT